MTYPFAWSMIPAFAWSMFYPSRLVSIQPFLHGQRATLFAWTMTYPFCLVNDLPFSFGEYSTLFAGSMTYLASSLHNILPNFPMVAGSSPRLALLLALPVAKGSEIDLGANKVNQFYCP